MSPSGNFVAEWFGHRVFPSVTSVEAALKSQKEESCPFLTAITGELRSCVKTSSSLGVCTISSPSNGTRQDWLVCPYRAVEAPFLADVVEHLFGPDTAGPRVIAPAPALASEQVRGRLLSATQKGGGAVVFLQDKLGGEISLSKTDRSPELSFDITFVELVRSGESGGRFVSLWHPRGTDDGFSRVLSIRSPEP